MSLSSRGGVHEDPACGGTPGQAPPPAEGHSSALWVADAHLEPSAAAARTDTGLAAGRSGSSSEGVAPIFPCPCGGAVLGALSTKNSPSRRRTSLKGRQFTGIGGPPFAAERPRNPVWSFSTKDPEKEPQHPHPHPTPSATQHPGETLGLRCYLGKGVPGP